MVLRGIAAARAAAGDVEGVRRAESAAILSGDIANKFLHEIARAQVKSGDISAAEKSFAEYIRSMPDSGASTDAADQASASVAAAQLEFGDIAGVLSSAARVRNGAAQAIILAGAAKAQAEHGDRTAATATIAKAMAAAQGYHDLYGYDKSPRIPRNRKSAVSSRRFSRRAGNRAANFRRIHEESGIHGDRHCAGPRRAILRARCRPPVP